MANVINFDQRRKARKVIVVTIGGEEKRIPVVSSISVKQAMEMKEAAKQGEEAVADWMFSFMRQHLGDSLDDLSMEEFQDLCLAWQDASSALMGESSALPTA